MLRRLITSDGRSKAYTNGRPVTLQQLRTHGEMLIDIHSQHEHQSLLRRDTHRRLLDELAGQNELAQQVWEPFRHWQTLCTDFEYRRANAEELRAGFKLLSYQVRGIDALDLAVG